MNKPPVFKEIVLVGGGHAHALVIKQWGMNPLPGVRLTLVSPDPQTPYSGMLPGLIAGHYEFDQIHIDLPKVCQWAGVRFIQDKVCNIDPENQTLTLSNRPNLSYDLVSLDIGSTPNHSVQGVLDYASPVKPIAGFYAHWQETVEQLRRSTEEKTVVVVGGGAGSVEVILAMAWAIKNDLLIKAKVQFKLIIQASSTLSSYPNKVIKKAEQACKEMNILIEKNFMVNAVEAGNIFNQNNEKHKFDHLFWCTQASAPTWLGDAGLTCTDDGFVRVNEYLQVANYATIFAAGDIAHMDTSPRPKAGVYAVRQAPILFQNIIHKILGQTLKPFHPQDTFFSLLSLGNKKAIGSRQFLPIISGAWAWRWKNKIDQKFMNIFHHLLPKDMSSSKPSVNPLLIPELEQNEKMKPEERCTGCGAKIGSQILEEVLTQLTGAYEPEDASQIPWPEDSLIQTIDQIKAPIDDPYLFGRIAVFHGLSDLFAMNAKPHSIHIAVTLPFAGREVQKRDLRLLLQGVLSACAESKVELLGGHSAEGHELSLSMSANGSVSEKMFTKQGLRAGDLLVLSKPLGTGLLLVGQMQGLTQGKDLALALKWMNHSNQETAGVLEDLGVNSCTDVTGFGLLGHLSEMMRGSSLTVEFKLEDLPVLTGALALVKSGIRSSLFPQNELSAVADYRWQALKDLDVWPVLLDPQTSGGLLAAIPADQKNVAIEAGLFVIGSVTELSDSKP